MIKFTFIVILFSLSLASANIFPSTLRNLIKPRALSTHYNSVPKSVEIKYFTQPVNHFDANDKRNFSQRYMEDCTYHIPNGPIVLFMGSANQGFYPHIIVNTPIREVAEMHNGCLLYPELRYTGQSVPFENFTLENWQYLKVDQILEDLASFIKEIKTSEEKFKDSKVVLVGLSGSATFVSWFRVKYPELSDGAWASSGPVEVKPDASELMVEIGNLFKKFGSQTCYDQIHNGFKAIEEDLKQGNMTRINKNFNVCQEFNPFYKKDAENLVSGLGSLFSASIGIHEPQKLIKDMCKNMSQVEDDIDAIGAALSIWEHAGDCLNATYKATIENLQNEAIDPDQYFRTLTYLACYHYGWWYTTEAKTQPFGTIVKLDYFVGMCQDIFRDAKITEESFYKNSQFINNEYGGWKGNYTNLYTTHGEFDPFRLFRLFENEDPLSQIEIIDGALGGQDINFFPYEPTPAIKTAILGAKYYISKWLNQ